MTTNPKSERPVRKAKREDFNETNCREVIVNLNNTKPHPPPRRREPEKKQIEQPAEQAREGVETMHVEKYKSDPKPTKQQKNKKNLIDGLTAQDFVDIFNTAAEKSGSPTRARVQERPKTTPAAAINLRQKHLNEPGKLDGK